MHGCFRLSVHLESQKGKDSLAIMSTGNSVESKLFPHVQEAGADEEGEYSGSSPVTHTSQCLFPSVIGALFLVLIESMSAMQKFKRAVK